MTKKLSTRGAIASSSGLTGSVQKFQDTQPNLRITNINGKTKQIADVGTANIAISGDKSLPSENKRATSLNRNGKDIFLAGENVSGSIDIGPGVNNSLTYTQK